MNVSHARILRFPRLPAPIASASFAAMCFGLLAVPFTPSLKAEMPIEQLAGRSAREMAQQTHEVDAVTAEMVAKFHALAPAREFDGLLKRLSAIPVSPYGTRGGVSGDELLLTEKVIGARAFITGWQDYLIQRDLGNSQQAAGTLQQLVAASAAFTAIPRSELIELQSHSPIADKSVAKAQEARTRLEKLTTRVVDVIENARDPGDLDVLAAEIGAMPPPPYNGYQRDEDYAKRVQNLKYFVQNYQDYLAAVHAGKALDAQRDLQGLSNPNYDASFYPRSRILDLMSAAPKVDEPTLPLFKPSAVNLENLDEFISQLAALHGNAAFMAKNETGLEPAAMAVRRQLEQIRSGTPRAGSQSVSFGPSYGGLGEYEFAFARMDGQLDLLSAPISIGAPADLQPSKDETLAAYLDRVLNAALARKDWTLALHTADFRRDTRERAGNRESASNDAQALYSFTRGLNFEAAEQWVDAVINFTNVLNFPGSIFPLSEVTSRLAKIKAAHPSEYDAAKAALLRRITDPQQGQTIRTLMPGQPGYVPGQRQFPQGVNPVTGQPQ